MHPLYYRSDPIFKTWNRVEGICHRKIKYAHPRLRSYFIDAMSNDDIFDIQKNNYVAITNNILDDSFSNVESILRVKDSFYGVYYNPYPIYYTTSSKNFNCFINRMDVFRQSWLYQLVRRGLFEQGYISFNMDITRMPDNKELTQIQAFERQFQKYCSIFAQEHSTVKDLVPYKNFNDDGNLTDVILDSKFSIVLETYFDNNHIITYSEKIFRCLQLPRPWVLFSHQHAVAHLRKMGFDLLDDIVDHSQYDIIESEIERQVKLLDIIETLVHSNLDNFQQRLIAAAQHNQLLLKQFSENWESDLNHTIELALKKLNV